MRRTGGILLVALVAILPVLPLPSLLLHNPDARSVPAIPPVHDFDVAKWLLAAICITLLSAIWLLARNDADADTDADTDDDTDAEAHASGNRDGSTDGRAVTTLRLPYGAIPAFALSLLALASMLWSADPTLAQRGAAHLLLVAALYVVGAQLLSSIRTQRRTAIGIGTAAVAVAAYGVLQRAGIDFAYLPWSGNGKPVSTLGNTNYASEFLVVAIPMLLALGIAARRVAVEAAAFAGCALAGLHLAITETRAGWISLGAGCIAALTVYGLERRRHAGEKIDQAETAGPSTSRKAAWIAATLAAVGVALFLPALDGESVARKAGTVLSSRHPSTQVRVQLWKSTAEMIADRPISGVGAGNFPVRYPAYRSPEEIALSGSTSRVDTAHNDFLHIAAELGLPGLILWLVLLGSIAATVLLRDRSRPGALRGAGPMIARERDLLRLGAVAAATAFVVNGLFRSPLDNPAAVLTFAVAAAMLATHPTARTHRIAIRRGAMLAAAAAWIAACLFATMVTWRDRAEDLAVRRAISWEASAAGIDGTTQQQVEKLGHLLENVEAALMSGLKTAPSSFELSFRLGQTRSRRARLLQQAGDADAARSWFEGALDSFERASRLRPLDTATRVNIASQAAYLGDLDRAETELQQAAAMAPNDPIVHFNRGLILQTRGDFGAAALSFEQSAGIRPRHERTLEALAQSYEQMQVARPEVPTYLPLIDNARSRLAVARALNTLDRAGTDQDTSLREARSILEQAARSADAQLPELLYLLNALRIKLDGEEPTPMFEDPTTTLPASSWLHDDPTYQRISR